MLSEFTSLGENQGKSCLAQEKKCTTPCVFPCTSDHGYFTNCQLRGCRERRVGYRQHDFHLPKVKATRNSGSEVPRAQRTCRQESGGLPVTVCRRYNFYFERQQYIHILNIGHSTLLQKKKKANVFLPRSPPRRLLGLANAVPPMRTVVRRARQWVPSGIITPQQGLLARGMLS